MRIKNASQTISTNGSGAATNVMTGNAFLQLVRVKYTPGTLAAGGTITLTDGDGDTICIIDTDIACDFSLDGETATDDLASGGGWDVYRNGVVNGPLTATTASGGASKSGTLEVIYFF